MQGYNHPMPASLTNSNHILHLRRTDRPSTFEVWYQGDSVDSNQGRPAKKFGCKLEGEQASGLVEKEIGSKHLWKSFAFCPQTGSKGFLESASSGKLDVLTQICDNGDTPQRILENLARHIRDSSNKIELLNRELGICAHKTELAHADLTATYKGFDFHQIAQTIKQDNAAEVSSLEKLQMQRAIDDLTTCKLECIRMNDLIVRRNTIDNAISLAEANLHEVTSGRTTWNGCGCLET